MFPDRVTAGRLLGRAVLAAQRPETHADVVLGLPRGGVPVAAEVALALGAPLDVIIVRKLGAPGHHELAIGALGEDGIRVLNDDVIRALGLSGTDIEAVEQRERAEVQRRTRHLRTRHARRDLRGAAVVIVDDGMATGATARAACIVAREHGARHVTLAMPVAPSGWEEDFVDVVDECIALSTPPNFMAVGSEYRDFSEVTDTDVDETLGQPTGQVIVPDDAKGIVLFAHGSGSSHASPRNRHVARILRHRGFGTVLVDLLSAAEADDRRNVFDIDLLAERLVTMMDWVHERADCEHQPLSLFGASTGAAAALRAAALAPGRVASVVSRGGRPDLTTDVLPVVAAPTLLIVGDLDVAVLELNREAASHMRCTHELAIIPGATHLFEEPGTLDEVAVLAAAWFERFGSLDET